MKTSPENYSILYVGRLSQYGDSSTCVHRYWALKKLALRVDTVDVDDIFHWNFVNRVRNFMFCRGWNVGFAGTAKVGEAVLKRLEESEFDLLWIDKGVWISGAALHFIKERHPQIKLIGYSPDDMGQRHNQSVQFLSTLPEYDLFVTTKSYNVPELKALGCREVMFIGNAYEETFHYPRDLNEEELKRYRCDVGFIGAYERERAESIRFLADNAVPVRVFGNNWSISHPNISVFPAVFNEGYCKALSATRINLAFLRKINRDQQTTRSVEIPACGGFMLAERTAEHLELFKEGEEAEFFSSNGELLEKCRYYLAHEDERVRIARAGLRRCIESGYSNRGRLKSVLDHISKSGGGAVQ